MRARNLRYHMCEMHNILCETLRQTSSFPQPDFIFHTLTAEEYKLYGHGKPISAPRKKKKQRNKHIPNRVVYEDISEDGDVPTAPNDGVVNIVEPNNDPVLFRIRLKSYPAAAGSASQSITDRVVIRTVERGSTPPTELLDDGSALHTYTQTDRSYGFSDVVLDRIEHYVRQAFLRWQVRTLLPGLFNILPSHDPSMLAISLTSVIRGISIAPDAILRKSAAQPILRFEGRDVLILEDRLVYLMKASGIGPVV